MSHDKKKSKKSVNDVRVPVETVCDTAKGSASIVQKGSGDAKNRVRNAIPDTKITSNKASKSKR